MRKSVVSRMGGFISVALSFPLLFSCGFGYTENITDESGMLDGLGRWAAVQFPNDQFVRDKSKCELVPAMGPVNGSPYVVRTCVLATRALGSNSITRADVYVAGRDYGLLFHLKTPNFDPHDDAAWDQIDKDSVKE